MGKGLKQTLLKRGNTSIADRFHLEIKLLQLKPTMRDHFLPLLKWRTY